MASRSRRDRSRHSWAQRALLALSVLVVLACFGGAGALVAANQIGNSLARVDLDSPALDAVTGGSGLPGAVATTSPATDPVTGETLEPPAPTETFPAVDPQAKNFLITGADNNACIDPDSPYAAAFGDRATMGERSDTIMIMRVDPSTKRAAVLSFPRDLWVPIYGRGSSQRINTAYVKDDPRRLIDTIATNFIIPVDHWVQIDFCAFKTIVDGLGGVSVPFEYPARDRNSGLNVWSEDPAAMPAPACYTFDGDHALAYVRSRYYQYYEDGRWKTDGVSDLGRISRQQDFIRRVLSAALDRGVTDPSVARSLINAAQNNVVVDRELTIDRMLEFAGVLRDFEPGGIATYQIESVGANKQGNSVLIPKLEGENMQAILRIFRGQAPLAGAPEQVFEPGTSAPGTTVDEAPDTTPPATAPAEPAAEENPKGIYPPADVSC